MRNSKPYCPFQVWLHIIQVWSFSCPKFFSTDSKVILYPFFLTHLSLCQLLSSVTCSVVDTDMNLIMKMNSHFQGAYLLQRILRCSLNNKPCSVISSNIRIIRKTWFKIPSISNSYYLAALFPAKFFETWHGGRGPDMRSSWYSRYHGRYVYLHKNFMVTVSINTSPWKQKDFRILHTFLRNLLGLILKAKKRSMLSSLVYTLIYDAC